MIAIGVAGRSICPEAFAAFVVIVVYLIARPRGFAFNTKVIVGSHHKIALPGLRFENALCQLDGSWYAGALHFLYGKQLVGVNVLNDCWILSPCNTT